MHNNKNYMLSFDDFVKNSERYKGLPSSVLEKHPHVSTDYQEYCDRYKQKSANLEKKTHAEIMSGKQKSADLEKKTHAEIMSGKMPVWRDTARAAPNSVLRSALFGASKPGARQEMKWVDIPSTDNIKIKYTGERLDQSDLDVWCGVMQFARDKSGTISFSSNEMLDLLGHSTAGGGNHESLYGKLLRLQRGSITVQVGNEAYTASLINSIAVDGVRKNYARKYTVDLNNVLLLLFASNSWSAFDWSVRRKLGKKALALWVHCFYSTHKNPWVYSVDKIYTICGSDAKTPRQFKAELKKAITVVCDAAGWDGFIDDNGNVHIIKSQKNTKDIQQVLE